MNRAITAKHRIIIVGKASTLSAQLRELADMTAGRVPQWQDIDPCADYYNPNVSKGVLK